MTTAPATQPPSVMTGTQVAADVTVFNVDLFGGYDSLSKCFVVKRKPTSVENGQPYSLTNFKQDIEKLLLDLTGSPFALELPAQLNKVMDKTMVEVNEVYLKIAAEKGGSEYAIWVEIDGSQVDMPVRLNRLYFKAWRTVSKEIVDGLQVDEFQQLLALTSGTPKQIPAPAAD